MVCSGMLAEVLSDLCLLELLLGELRRRAKILRKAGVVSSPQKSMKQHICFISLCSKHDRTTTESRRRVINLHDHYSECGIKQQTCSWIITFTFKVSYYDLILMWISAAHLYLWKFCLSCLFTFLCFLDPQQLPCVEDSERLLTTCMLQVVSVLTLRSIKNTGRHIHFFSCSFSYL